MAYMLEHVQSSVVNTINIQGVFYIGPRGESSHISILQYKQLPLLKTSGVFFIAPSLTLLSRLL